MRYKLKLEKEWDSDLVMKTINNKTKKLKIKNIILVLIAIIYIQCNTELNYTVLSEEQKIYGTEVGMCAYNLELKDKDGNLLKTSELRGKYVLLDFWASWCGPCRAENPNLIKAYEKYNKAKFKQGYGFEIYGVSVDKNIDSWKNTMQNQGLIWKYNVNDPGDWSSESLRKFGIRSIPSNFLLDPNGVIIDKNIRGNRLHLVLDDLISEF